MIEIIINKVQIAAKPRNLRAYQAGRLTAERAAELLIAKAEGEGYVDTIPNRVGLLAAENGAGLRRLEEVVGLHGKEIQGTVVTMPGEPGEGEQIDGQGLAPIPIDWKKGDRATWVSQGVVQLANERIRKVEDGHAFFRGSEVGVPFEELEKPGDQDASGTL